MRERLFTMRMSEEETQRLEVVAEHYGLSAADVIRMLVKRDYDANQARNRTVHRWDKTTGRRQISRKPPHKKTDR